MGKRSSTWRKYLNRRWWTLALFLLTIAVAPGRAQEQPVWRVAWQTVPDADTAQIRHQLQRFTRQHLTPSHVEQVVRSALRERAYYFPRITVQLDSTERRVIINPGKQLVLTAIHWTVSGDSAFPPLESQLFEVLLNEPYWPEVVQTIQELALKFCHNRGYPLAQIRQKDFQIREATDRLALELTLEITTGPRVVLQDLVFEGKTEAESHYLQRLIGFKKGELYQPKRLQTYRLRLQRLPFVEQVGPLDLARDSTGQFFLITTLKEKPATAFDGILGYVPPRQGEDASGYLVGNVTIGIRNLLGPGRELYLFWRKPDPLSENFRLDYRESFLLGLPLHLIGGLNRQVRDTTYIEWQYHARAEVPLTEDTRLQVQMTRRAVFPDTLASRLRRLPRTESVRTTVSLLVDRRNSFNNPTRGFLLELGFSLENQRNLGPLYLLKEDSLPGRIQLQRLEGRAGVYLPIRQRHVISNVLHMKWVASSGKRLYQPDLFYFGGSTSLRGYREDQFLAGKLVWLNTEYRVITGSTSRLFVFVDNGAFEETPGSNLWRFLLGYGLGARFKSPLGTMQVEMALARGEPFREAKIHFRLINEF